jgi:hypothetical protein
LGEFRFAQARTFNDSPLRPAQSDDKHHRIYTLDPSVHVVDIYGRDGNIHQFENLPFLQMFHRVGDCDGRLIDYYLYCFTSRQDSLFLPNSTQTRAS